MIFVADGFEGCEIKGGVGLFLEIDMWDG